MQPDLDDGEPQRGPILDRLGETAHVLYVERMADGTVRLREACDGVFSVRLTADELRALAGELINIAGRSSARSDNDDDSSSK